MRTSKITGLGGARIFTIIEDLEHTAKCRKAIRARWDEESTCEKGGKYEEAFSR